MAFLQEIWSKEIQASPIPYNVVHTTATSFDAAGVTIGDVIHVPVVTYAVATNPGVGGLVTFNDGTVSEVAITIATEKNYGFKVKDIEQAQTNVEIRAAHAAGANSALNAEVDKSLLELAASLTTNVVGTFETALTKEVILAAKIKLDTQNAPQFGRMLCVSPTAYGQLLLIAEFTDVSKYGPNVSVMNGELGRIYGFSVFMSNFVKTADANINTVLETYNVAYVKETFGTAKSIANRVVAMYDIDYKQWKVVADVLYGVQIINEKFGVLVKS